MTVSCGDGGNESFELTSMWPLDGLLKPPRDATKFLNQAGCVLDGHGKLHKRYQKHNPRFSYSQAISGPFKNFPDSPSANPRHFRLLYVVS